VHRASRADFIAVIALATSCTGELQHLDCQPRVQSNARHCVGRASHYYYYGHSSSDTQNTPCIVDQSVQGRLPLGVRLAHT
jgi:hypothetical protein